MGIDKDKLQQAVIFQQQQEFNKAREIYLEQLAIQPDHISILSNLGLLEHQSGNHEIGINYIDTCVKLEPSNPNHLYNKGAILERINQYAEAIECFEKVNDINQNDAESFFYLGNCYLKLKRTDDAIYAYEQSLSINPNNPEVQCALGKAFLIHHDLDMAEKHFNNTLSLDNKNYDAYIQLARLNKRRNNFETAINFLKKIIELNADLNTAFVELAGYQLNSCDWSNYDNMVENLFEITKSELEEGKTTTISPFRSLQFEWDPSFQLQIAKSHSELIKRNMAALRKKLNFQHVPHNNPRLKLGYISSDFRNHTVGHLCQGLFKQHNREKFEIFAYATCADDGSEIRQRIENNCDHFFDLSAASFEEAAQKIYDDKIDILIDLTGHTNIGEAEILALRPAPIQAHYLGFLGTMGADFVDYIITDKIVTPPEEQENYSEKFLYMPNTYQINSHNHDIAETPTRNSCGLPEDKFVFCSFNNNYKITPKVFDAWMEILRQQENAVIWLYQTDEYAKNNLIKEAAQRGVDTKKLIFASKVPRDQHLARLRCADLYLDTFIASARTSASDALWAGLPILTLPGKTFSNRVGASLLSAVGLTELIASDTDNYIQKALHYTNNPDALKDIKTKLNDNIETEPLFDTERFVRDLESVIVRLRV